ncbi:hypothetical protein M885DRAFT_611579 [Pelagophyceae sp. CCMP2097]|nr:hypothetical protein M885DRAFT_611579 [Pelagophyceae sp. CCMP2097]|mmetsp:Transcript_5594/g.19882  ORF Transcript_5594/g.19882 Transcript_5594/m.19882 type:complete len:473 (+) Transcript_5594:63-1481(+)
MRLALVTLLSLMAHSLVPSSVLRKHGHSVRRADAAMDREMDEVDRAIEAVAMDVEAAEAPPPKKGAPKKKKGKKKSSTSEKCRLSGKYANVGWRTIPMDAVRAHPLFKELPRASDVCKAERPSLSAASLFRQDGRRWRLLHEGKLTGAHIAAVCGLYEADAAEKLRLPRSLQGHSRAVDSWNHWRRGGATDDVVRIFEDFEDDSEEEDESIEACWRLDLAKDAYLYAPTFAPRRLMLTESDRQARLAWGTIQEGVGIVAAMDFVRKRGGGAIVAEAGMLSPGTDNLCARPPGAVKGGRAFKSESLGGADLDKLLGASPDGLILHADGSVEILEVKSVSPFQKINGTLHLRDRGPHANVGAWIVPQVMLEIYCAGPRCHSALLASVSATKGATFIEIKRDDDYVREMLRLSRRFHDRFCAPGQPPPPPCFNADEPGFDEFLRRTAQIAAEAPLRGRVQSVHRAPPASEAYFVD